MSHEGSPSRKRLQKQGDGFRCMASGMVHSLGRESPISPWIVGGEVVAFPTLEPPLSLQGRDWQLCTRKGIQGPWQRPGAGFSLCPGTFLGELGFLGKLWTHFWGDFRLAQEAGDTRPGICGFCRHGQGQERGSHLGSRILPLASFQAGGVTSTLLGPCPRLQSGHFCAVPLALDSCPGRAGGPFNRVE